MTDTEDIKALEEHIEHTKNIKYGARKMVMVDVELLKNTLDLINAVLTCENLRKQFFAAIVFFQRSNCCFLSSLTRTGLYMLSYAVSSSPPHTLQHFSD